MIVFYCQRLVLFSNIVHPCYYESVPEHLFGPTQHCPHTLREKFNLFFTSALILRYFTFNCKSTVMIQWSMWHIHTHRHIMISVLVMCAVGRKKTHKGGHRHFTSEDDLAREQEKARKEREWRVLVFHWTNNSSTVITSTGFPVPVGRISGRFSTYGSGSGRQAVNCQISEPDILLIYY